MPNWCENDLVISGSEDSLKEFFYFLKREGDEIKLVETFLPLPSELEGTSSPSRVVSQEEYDSWESEDQPFPKYATRPITKEIQEKLYLTYGVDNWYDWQRLNWGVKWGDCRTRIDGNEIHYDTPWGPFDDEVLEAISKRFPSLTFTLHFYEAGMAFQGKRIYQDGETAFASDSKYHGDRGG